MSTLKTNNVQVGQSVTATNNFTLYQPASPDGTVRLGVGNSGATTLDAVTVTSAGNVTVAGSLAATAVTSTSTPIPVSSGGTGASTLTANNVILGNGTSAVAFVAPGTNGNVLTSNGTTWTSASATLTTAQVLSATAGAAVGDVGSYALLFDSATLARSPGATLAGSTLRYTSCDGAPTTTAPSGTWRIMGATTVVNNRSSTSVWLRIS